MIGKRVTGGGGGGKSKAAHGRDLTDYISKRDRKKENEKVLFVDGRNFLCDDFESRQTEMVALAHACVRSKNPFRHYILSWQEGEHPKRDQVEQAVSIFLDELGFKDHQIMYALHDDTNNTHLHLVLNRVHPDTEKVAKPNRGFDIEAVHRAVARIEHAQGWKPERRARYQVLDDGRVVRRSKEKKRDRDPTERARTFEARTGAKSAQRIAKEQAGPLIKAAQSWEDLHKGLAELGIRYSKKGSGAVLWVGETAVKASSAGRHCSFRRLESRLGAFEASQDQEGSEQKEPEPLKPHALGWQEYTKARSAYFEGRARERGIAQKQHDDDWKSFIARQKKERKEILSGNWRGKGVALNAMRSVLAARQAAEKAKLREDRDQRLSALKKRYPKFPDFEKWLEHEYSPEMARSWRYRDDPSYEMNRLSGGRYIEPKPQDIRSFEAEIRERTVLYRWKHKTKSPVAFVDRGKDIYVHTQERTAVRAALQLAAQKWGPRSLEVRGTEEFKRLCVEVAAELGIGIRFKEPQMQIEMKAEKKRQEEKKKQEKVGWVAEKQRKKSKKRSTGRDAKGRGR